MYTQTSTTLLEGLADSSDQGAWRKFDARYRPLVLAVARRMGLQNSDAEDAAQETMAAFVQAYRESRYDREKGSLKDWLRGFAYHKVRDLQRRRGREERPLVDKTDATRFLNRIEDKDVEAVWDEEWDNAVLRQCFEEIRQSVEPRTFEAFRLFVLEEWPAKRVASHLQVSEDVVYQSKSRILSRVRELLPQVAAIW